MLITWLIVFVLAIILEIVTTLTLTSIWFACGAIVAILLDLLGVDQNIQILVFFVISLLCMIVVRPLASRYLRGNTTATNADRLVGEVGVVNKTIQMSEWGEVYIKKTYWSAVSVDRTSIEEGCEVRVLAIEGAKLVVKKI